MKRTIGLLIILASIFSIPFHVFAVDYSIEEMEINAYLQKNGDVYVTEDQTYSFNGKFNGITRSLIPKKDTPIINVEATEDNTKLDVEQDDNLYKVYRNGKNESITIQLTYTIKDAVTAYEDVAEFYWPFFDTNNESDYEKLDVFVHPPSQTNDVIAFGYDAAEETATTKGDGTAHFSMGKVQSETTGDIRVAYDVKIFPQVTITENKPMRAELVAEKDKLENKREAFKTNQAKLSRVAPFVIGLFSLFLIGLLLYAWRKKRATMMDIDRLYPLPYFVPKEEMSLVATLSYTSLGGALQPETLTAALLDLVRKDYVQQTDEATFIDNHRKTDHAHERMLIDWLFYKVGHKGTFKLDDLTAYTNKESNHKLYYNDFSAWKKAVQDEVKQNELTESKTKLKVFVGFIGLSILPFIVCFIIYELFGFMFWSILLFVGLLTFAIVYYPRTPKGTKLMRDWTEFRKKYTDMSDQKWLDLVDNEQKRAFIYGIGSNNQQIKNKNKALLEHMPTIQDAGMSPVLFLVIASQANSYFGQANKVSASSVSGSGTPGAGGGTGVGGGGGGSGAF